MKKVKSLMKSYENSIENIDSKKLKRKEELKAKIKTTNKHLQELREYVRTTTFKDTEEEIEFFKNIKPKICGELKFYKKQLDYTTDKSCLSLNDKKEYLQKKLKKLEAKKRKNVSFYRYIKREETTYDLLYFTRTEEQYKLFSLAEFVDIDPLFSTTHDQLTSEVITYDLLNKFYKQELHCLTNLELYDNVNNNTPLGLLNWTATKTDLVELIYALKVTGAINGGDAQIKEITELLGQFFNIDLGSYYKTYADIKNRTYNQAKFLNRLALTLCEKIEIDDF